MIGLLHAFAIGYMIIIGKKALLSVSLMIIMKWFMLSKHASKKMLWVAEIIERILVLRHHFLHGPFVIKKLFHICLSCSIFFIVP